MSAEPVEPRPEVALTPREAQIAQYIADGLDNAAISREINLAVDTVKTYLRGLMRAYDMHAREGLVPLLRRDGYGTPRPVLCRLSAREREVLQGVAAGMTNQQIARALHISALTVKSHMQRIASRAGEGKRGALVAMLCDEQQRRAALSARH